MVHVGNEIYIYAIILLSVAMLFFPVQQGYGFFTLSPELTEEELIELYELEQLVKAEQTRDEIFVLRGQQNPYLDTASNVTAYFENNEKSPNSLDRIDENFQLIKDEQISVAEKKYKEILGWKTIANFLNNEPVNKKSIHGFKIDNQTGFMKRNSDGFQNYTLLQISIAEDFRDNNWKEITYQKEPSYPYQNIKPITMLSTIEEYEILKQSMLDRQNEKFKNSIIEQISLAENIRNEMLDSRIAPNPYLDETLIQNMDENMDESLDITNRNFIITGWSDPTYVPGKLEINIIDREFNGFEMVKTLEIEIAQNTLNEILLLSNSEEMDDEVVSLTNENKKLNNIERDDQGFEFFKNKQIDAAEKKLMKILGQKNIHNPDY